MSTAGEPFWTAARKALLRATVLENPFVPHHVKFGDGDKIVGLTKRQAVFLVDDRREVLYGGAGGGGKSIALLIAAAQYVTVPRYNALILRRNFKQLSKAESILDAAKAWWCGRPDVRYLEETRTFRFPSGATVEFGHMDEDNARFNYAGPAYQYVGYDELTQFRELTYTFLFTRLRRRADGVAPIRMRSSANPGGIGHAWVKKRFIDEKTRLPGVGFVPAKLEDNPNLDRADYETTLEGTDALTRQQIRAGNWNAIEGGRFREDWLKHRYLVDAGFVVTPFGERFLPHKQPVFQTCDPNASASATADRFALSTWCVSPKSYLVWLGCKVARLETPDQVAECQRLYKVWLPQFVGVEEVLNQRALAQLLRRSDKPVMVVRGLSPRGTKKLPRAVGGINLAFEGRLLLPRGEREFPEHFPLEDVVTELTAFTGEDGCPDDIVDTISYAAELLPHLHAGPAAAPGAVFPAGGLRPGAPQSPASSAPVPPPAPRPGGPRAWGT